MHALDSFIQSHVAVAWLALFAAFTVLAKCADLFVDNSVSLAHRLRVPRLVIGIVLVSLATTMPELAVSLVAALRGRPEMALGNAIGSVICNAGLALALCALVSAAPVTIIPRVLKTSTWFLSAAGILCFAFVAFDHSLNRLEGLALLGVFAWYITVLYRQHRAGKFEAHVAEDYEQEAAQHSLARILLLLALSVAGIILASEFIVSSATSIARWLRVPQSVIALTMVALGTSVPEIATCVTAARKGHGDLAVGNILGANIMNICWVAGASAMANTLTLGARELYFMFPAMFVLGTVMLVTLRTRHRLARVEGLVLLGFYVAYLAAFLLVFRPSPA